MKVEFVNLRQAGQDLLPAAVRLAAWHYRQGRRVLILAGDQLQAEEVDRLLWTLDPASFVPHAQAGGAEESGEPVLIALGAANLNQAAVLIMLAPLEPGQAELTAYGQVIDFVPAGEGPELSAARERYRQWSSLAGVDMVHTTRLPA